MKLISLIKVSLNHDMNIFRIYTKKQSTFSKIILPLIITFYIMFVIGVYAKLMIDALKPLHLEFIVLTVFSLLVSVMTFIEGVYKSGSLLFNCKDDQLMFSLPIKKSTVLFVRILKFYIFEFLYNSLFLLPGIIIYAYNVNPSWHYYLTSFFALLSLPIVPVALSCLFGFAITYLSSKFKGKNIFQTIFTMLFLVLILYLSYNMNGFITDFAKHASSINDFIIKLYYPVGTYVSLINDFNIKTLLIYIFINITILFVTVFILGKTYFKISSNFKRVLTSSNKNYVIKSSSKMIAFIKKELNRFFSTPVFITNAGFGLVLYVGACLYASIKFDSIISIILKSFPTMNTDIINSNLPAVMFILICFVSFMTSITSSMISLESKSFNILKSLPIEPFKIVLYKVLSALVIMLPCILIGDIIIFIRFKFDFISILLLLLASIILPFLSQLIGIIVNLKYPKLDATNDTEIVKQSMSSMVSVFTGMGLLGCTGILIFKMLEKGFTSNMIILSFTLVYGLVSLILSLLLVKTCDKSFKNITT